MKLRIFLGRTQPFYDELRDVYCNQKFDDMKKTLLILSLLVSQAIASLAAEVNVNAILTGAGEGVAVTFYEITLDPMLQDSTLTELCNGTTDANGSVGCSVTTQANSGYIAASFTNCYGELVYTEFYFDATIDTNISIALNYCPVEEPACGIYFSVDSVASTDFNVILQVQIEGNPTSYSWDFGDGSTSTEAYPSHTYATVGEYNVCLSITTAEGCVLTQCVMISINAEGVLGGGAQQAFTLNVVEGQLLGIEDQNEVAELSVYPNPTSDQARVAVSVKQGGKAYVSLYNLAGQCVSQETTVISANQAMVNLDLSNQNAGLYMVKVVFENGTSVSQSLIKK